MQTPGEPLRFGSFEILRNEDGTNAELGRGSYGLTYKARHRFLKKIVALKVIHDRHMDNGDAKQRFLTEAQVVASLDHQNIARVFDFGEHEGIFFYAMEFCDGGSLEDLSKARGPMGWQDLRFIARQTASALSSAHRAGVLHRDVKPTNLMLVDKSDTAKVKLIDFGLVKILDSEANSSTFQMVTRDGGFVGNPMSAAPEQLLEEALDARTDLFALGVTLWYMLLGRSPFEGLAPAKLIHERLSSSPYKVGDVEGLDAHGRSILERLIAKNPDERFSSADELIKALDNPGVITVQEDPPVQEAVSPAFEEIPPVMEVPVPVAQQSTEVVYDGVVIAETFSSSPEGIATRAAFNGNHGLLLVHSAVADLQFEQSGKPVEPGTYGGEPAIFLRDASQSKWENLYSLKQQPSRAEIFSWCLQLASVSDHFSKNGFSDLDFQPGSILLLNAPVKSPEGISYWVPAPRFGSSDGNEDIWKSIGGDSLAPTPLAGFAALLYRMVSGMRLRPAAFIKEAAYIKTPNLSELGNNLLARTLCAKPEDGNPVGYLEFIHELCRYEQMVPPEQAIFPAALGSAGPATNAAPVEIPKPPALPPQIPAPVSPPVIPANTVPHTPPPILNELVTKPIIQSQPAPAPTIPPAPPVVTQDVSPAPEPVAEEIAEAKPEVMPVEVAPEPPPPVPVPQPVIEKREEMPIASPPAPVSQPQELPPSRESAKDSSPGHRTDEAATAKHEAAKHEEISQKSAPPAGDRKKKTLIIAAVVGGVLLLGGAVVAALMKGTPTKEEIVKKEPVVAPTLPVPPEKPIEKPPETPAPVTVKTFRKLDVGVLEWLKPGGKMSLRGKDSLSHASLDYEKGDPKVLILSSLSEKEITENAPWTFRIVYEKEGRGSVTFDVDAGSFVPSSPDSDTLKINSSPATAKMSGWIFPEIQPAIAGGSAGMGKIRLAQSDGISARTPSSASGTSWDGERLKFELAKQSFPPAILLASSQFSGEIKFDPFAMEAVPSATVVTRPMKVSIEDLGVYSDSIEFLPSKSGGGGLANAISAYVPKASKTEKAVNLVAGQDYEIFIRGGPLDSLRIGKVKGGEKADYLVPQFDPGYIIGYKLPINFNINEKSIALPVISLLSCPANEPWRIVFYYYFFNRDVDPNKPEFFVSEAVLKVKSLENDTITFDVDSEAAGKRISNAEYAKVFRNQTVSIPRVWRVASDKDFRFKDATVGQSEFNLFASSTIATERFNAKLSEWPVDARSKSDSKKKPSNSEIDAFLKASLPSENRLLGRDTFKEQIFGN